MPRAAPGDFPARQVDSGCEKRQEQTRTGEVFKHESVESADHLDWRTPQVHTVSNFAAHAGRQECRANAVACDVAHGDVAHVLAGEVHLTVVAPHTGERLVSHVDFGLIGSCRIPSISMRFAPFLGVAPDGKENAMTDGCLPVLRPVATEGERPPPRRQSLGHRAAATP